MNLNLKQAEKVSKGYEKIKKHHEDIVRLESIVELILQSENGTTINIKAKKPKDNKVTLTEDGMSTTNVWVNYLYDAYTKCSSEDKDNVTFETELNDLLSLELIGLLISEKKKAIEQTLKSIKL